LTIKSCQIFYQNLQALYNKHNYVPNHICHIWKSNETSIQAGRKAKVKLLVGQGSRQVYNTIPQSKEWLTINYVVNIIMTTLAGLYISKRKMIQNDYI
jgi:hypothetical protein